jgi:basic amino acid/polyamine antiporter, APA family
MPVATTDDHLAEGGTELKRAIAPRVLLLFVLGDILGTGIYALVGEVGAEVGGAIWTSLLLALLLAFFTAGSYAELVTKYPKAAGAALYVNKAFKQRGLTFMVTFAVMASGLTSAGTAARAFGGDYLAEFVTLPLVLVAIGFVVVLTLINYIGISESTRVNVVFTLIEATGLLVIIVIGIAALVGGDGEPSRAFEFKGGTAVPLAIMGGAALSFYALIGFEDSVNLAEEAKEPHRSFPRALFGGLLVASVIYLFVAFTASMLVPTARLTDSSSPLLEVVELGPLSIPTRLFSAIALVAIFNTALINLIMASRLLYGMARQGILPAVFGKVGERRRTPYVAILFTAGIAISLILTAEVEALAETTVLLLLTVFILVNISVLRLRPDTVDHEHFVTPSVLPVLGIIACAALITQTEADIFLRAGILLIIGLLLWAFNRAVLDRTGA